VRLSELFTLISVSRTTQLSLYALPLTGSQRQQLVHLVLANHCLSAEVGSALASAFAAQDAGDEELTCPISSDHA
jgi:hypothetical protein